MNVTVETLTRAADYPRSLVEVGTLDLGLYDFCGGCAEEALAAAIAETTEDDYQACGLARYDAARVAVVAIAEDGCDECRATARFALAVLHL